MFTRPTSLAAAFMKAAIKVDHQQPLDLQKGSGNWVARRVALNATERGQFGMTTEYDKRPTPPKMRAALEHDTPRLSHEEDFSDIPY